MLRPQVFVHRHGYQHHQKTINKIIERNAEKTETDYGGQVMAVIVNHYWFFVVSPGKNTVHNRKRDKRYKIGQIKTCSVTVWNE